MNILRVGSITAGGNIILVTTDSGATVYAVSGGKVVSGVAVGGVAKLKVKAGTWRVWAELDGQQTSEVEVIVTDSYYKEMSFGLPLSRLAVGSLVRLKESGADANYRVVHQGLPSSLYDSSCNGTWVLREAVHSNQIFHSSSNNYASSSIHSWLGSTFLGLFDSNTQAVIKQIKIPYVNGTGYNSLSSGANGLSTKIFLLSSREVGFTASYDTYGYSIEDGACLSYFSGTAATDAKRIAYLNGGATSWWLRVPRKNKSNEALLVYNTGSVTAANMSSSQFKGARPAMVLDNAAMVNPTPNADGSYTLMV